MALMCRMFCESLSLADIPGLRMEFNPPRLSLSGCQKLLFCSGCLATAVYCYLMTLGICACDF